jgi:DNA-binding response OmpR family regulator
MNPNNLLDNKRILVVDDEPDILDTLEDLLPMCDVVKADNADDAATLLDSETFDIAILDIMGVNGYELLMMASKKGIISVMLTAHAFSVEDTIQSAVKGASLYVPKEKMEEIQTYLNDILEAKQKGKSFWWRWKDRFESFYQERFGPKWREENKHLWAKFPYLPL